MADLLHVEIAGVNFTIRCTSSVIFQDPDPYRQFIVKKRGTSPGKIDVTIRLELGKIPDIKNLRKIFDSGESWSMFQNGVDYYLTLDPPSFPATPLWLARFHHPFTHVTVYCGERLMSEKNGRSTVSTPFCYPLDQLLLMYVLSQREGVLLHAAGIDLKGRGCIFPGRSGAGKSTLLRQFAGRNVVDMLSDDRIVMRKINGEFQAFGTPWPGKEGIARNRSVPLSGIFFISHGSPNRIKEVKRREALERLLPMASIPWFDRETVPKMLHFCEDLVVNVPAYELRFNPGIEVIDELEKFIST